MVAIETETTFPRWRHLYCGKKMATELTEVNQFLWMVYRSLLYSQWLQPFSRLLPRQSTFKLLSHWNIPPDSTGFVFKTTKYSFTKNPDLRGKQKYKEHRFHLSHLLTWLFSIISSPPLHTTSYTHKAFLLPFITFFFIFIVSLVIHRKITFLWLTFFIRSIKESICIHTVVNNIRVHLQDIYFFSGTIITREVM